MRRSIFLIAMVAAALASASCRRDVGRTFTAELSPTDPKYNSPACSAARAETYDGLSPGQTVALGMVSGMAGTLAERRRDMFERRLELACMSNPPERPALEPGFTSTND